MVGQNIFAKIIGFIIYRFCNQDNLISRYVRTRLISVLNHFGQPDPGGKKSAKTMKNFHQNQPKS